MNNRWFPNLIDYFKRYVYFPQEEFYYLVGSYTVLTYCYRQFETVPYLYFVGPWGSGKTVSLECLGKVVFRPLRVSEITPSALIREIHKRRSTVIVDEAEYLDDCRMRRTFRSGYKRHGKITICGPGGTTRSYVVFCPKIAASVERPRDWGIISRTIFVPMIRAPHRLARFVHSSANDLAKRIVPHIIAFVRRNRERMVQKYHQNEYGEIFSASSRHVDVLVPLLVVVDEIHCEFPDLGIKEKIMTLAQVHVTKLKIKEEMEELEGLFSSYLLEYLEGYSPDREEGYYRMDKLLRYISSQGESFGRWGMEKLRLSLNKLEVISEVKRLRFFETVNGIRRQIQRMCIRFDRDKLRKIVEQGCR